MLELRTLGTIDLRKRSGECIDCLLPHSKRLSLLAYLAASFPPGLHRRDTLVGLLWPDLDETHARGALRHELYELRRCLGDDVLCGSGEVVGIDAQRLWCDANALEASIAVGRLETALELWRGEFLPGLHVDGGEFERWLDGRRDRLLRRVVDAARGLSVRAEEAGDAEGAVSWARRLTELAPCDETSWQRLIRLLDVQGDRSEALIAYDCLSARLQEELEVEPSPETRALVAGIRKRTAIRLAVR
jgi:serine/threonine-protein kinase